MLVSEAVALFPSLEQNSGLTADSQTAWGLVDGPSPCDALGEILYGALLH